MLPDTLIRRSWSTFYCPQRPEPKKTEPSPIRIEQSAANTGFLHRSGRCARLGDLGRSRAPHGVGRRVTYENPAQSFQEHAAFSGIAGVLARDFDISGLADLTAAEYANLAPIRWPHAAQKWGRFFAGGKFYTANGKAKMLAIALALMAAPTTSEHPFHFNTGRVRDQWHTMTRTAKSAKLSAHLTEPYLKIHPNHAEAMAIGRDDLVCLSNSFSSCILRAVLTRNVKEGAVFAPIYWTCETAPSGRINHLVQGAVDLFSGQPESKGGVVALERYPANWYGFAVSRSPIHSVSPYWAQSRTQKGWRCEMVGIDIADNWEEEAGKMFELTGWNAQTMRNAKSGFSRAAFYGDTGLEAALFVSRQPVAVMRDYFAGLPDFILSGQTSADQPDPGSTICSCFGVRLNTILAAVETDGLTTVDQVGLALQTGTNCGSCRPEIAALLVNV